IDGQTLLTPEVNRGIGTYFKNTVEHLLENDFTNDFYLAAPRGPHLKSLSPWAREKLCVVEHEAYDIRAPRSHSADLYSDAVNDELEKRGIDLYWSPNALMDNVFLPARETRACRFAVTIFDLIVLVMAKTYARHLPPAALAVYQKKLERLESDYDLYLHISRHTEADFRRALRVGDKRHVVTPLAAASSFRPYPFPEVADADPYVLYIGGFDPRKNMRRAVEAFARLQVSYGEQPLVRATRLCVACSLDNAAASDMLNYAESLGVRGKVWLTGFVDDDVLLALYQKARCLFFPSLYEGFGLPVLEGLACGLPVAASATSSLPEVGGEFAIYFDPDDVDAMADALYRALQEPMDYQSRLRRYEYSTKFSWRKTALATLEAFAGLRAEGT
ncbi:MAG TPA: glycosyltransferase family 1 protein, partial [Pyrinomonadaceae bacterium]|nr:glycosyltransferase family 1 protein [Pyrinomonadaceae bacterium]